MYNPQIGRWMAVDPLAEDYASRSPYEGIGNNPVNFIDPDGRGWLGDFFADLDPTNPDREDKTGIGEFISGMLGLNSYQRPNPSVGLYDVGLWIKVNTNIYIEGNNLDYVRYDSGKLFDSEGNCYEIEDITNFMQYSDHATWFKNLVGQLNEIGSVKQGKKLLNELSSAKFPIILEDNVNVNYGDYNKVSQISKELNTCSWINSIYELHIKAGFAEKVGRQYSIEVLAHELFHAYQFKALGWNNPRNVNWEVGAELFAKSVMTSIAKNTKEHYDPVFGGLSKNTPDGPYYQQIMTKLLLSREVDKSTFNYYFNRAVKLFKKGSAQNTRGNYNNYGIIPWSKYTPVVQDFLPD